MKTTITCEDWRRDDAVRALDDVICWLATGEAAVAAAAVAAAAVAARGLARHLEAFGAPDQNLIDAMLENHVACRDRSEAHPKSGEITYLVGHEAVDWAEANGIDTLWKYNDPIDHARAVTLEEAREILREDPGLIAIAPGAPARPPWGC